MKENIGELTDLPNKKYEKMFEQFSEIETLRLEQWKTVHILGYFCKRYESHYNSKYKFKFNSPSPSKCFEVFQVKKLASMLSSDPKILKEYMDWVFKSRVIDAKRKLTSISFMTVENLVNEFKMNYLMSDKKTDQFSRTTQLPIEYKNMFENSGFKILTYGDLAFIIEMSDKTPELIHSINELKNSGFDLSLLRRII